MHRWDRPEELEALLHDYIERFGLTEKARKHFFKCKRPEEDDAPTQAGQSRDHPFASGKA